MKPKLPTAAEILPYLETIDAHRWYSNWGPLAIRLEEQLARRLNVGSESVVTTGSGTAGLTAALLAREICGGSFCIMPSWTFAATPHAARAAGLVPWFHDVDPRTWALDPDAVAESIKQMHTRPGAVMVVSPFGAPADLAVWEAFEEHTGIPVVIDAAAGFDTVRASKIPCVVSLHATKILGAGEGGFIATTDSRPGRSDSGLLQFWISKFTDRCAPRGEWENERIPCCRCAGQPGSLAVGARAARPNFAMLPRCFCAAPRRRASAGVWRWLGLQYDQRLAARRFRGIDFPTPGAGRH